MTRSNVTALVFAGGLAGGSSGLATLPVFGTAMSCWRTSRRDKRGTSE